MAMQRDISSNALARLQRLQDLFSQYFDVTIQVVCRDDSKGLTVTSRGSTFCQENRDSSPDVCDSFLERMIHTEHDRITVTTCPFGILLAVAPLGKSLETGVHTQGRHLLVVSSIPLTSDIGSGQLEDDVAALFGTTVAVNPAEREEFFTKVQLIASAFDLIIALMESDRSDSGKTSAKFDSSLTDRLTRRELEIARLVSTGMTNQQIAEQLFLSEHTVKLHISNILRKLEVSNRTQLAIFGVQNF